VLSITKEEGPTSLSDHVRDCVSSETYGEMSRTALVALTLSYDEKVKALTQEVHQARFVQRWDFSHKKHLIATRIGFYESPCRLILFK
jgi:hypothetical protein